MTEEKKEEVKEEPKTEEKPKQEKPAAPKGGEPRPENSGREEKKEAPKKEKAKEEKEVEVPTKFKKLVGEIEEMKVAELAELVKILEKKFGVSAAPVAVASAAPASGAPAGAPEEKSSYNIELQSIGDKKIEVIKAVRDVTEKGLKEAKDLVDAAASAPQVVKENVKKEEAEEIKKKFELAGAKVELK